MNNLCVRFVSKIDFRENVDKETERKREGEIACNAQIEKEGWNEDTHGGNVFGRSAYRMRFTQAHGSAFMHISCAYTQYQGISKFIWWFKEESVQ